MQWGRQCIYSPGDSERNLVEENAQRHFSVLKEALIHPILGGASEYLFSTKEGANNIASATAPSETLDKMEMKDKNCGCKQTRPSP